jgi:hypothetical protein
LVATREHRVKVEDMEGEEGREIGELSFSSSFLFFLWFAVGIME